MSGYVLGCDVGTTGTKTVLFSSDGKAVKRAYRSYPTFTDGGISEQNAADLWTALCMTVREAVSDISPESVGAISLSTQGGTLIPVGKDGEPVRRAIVWSDRSCARERELFLSEIGGNDFLHERTGWRLVYGLPLLQVRRLRDREP
ncbi:MAG: FGGY family carbohydrate kinase, partial [Firmicutes bacterium]|nr:FGGY family carbohydrate kinase [Candidatus Colimorpha enterica]